jgi:mono/diheme cytochrome c family protein
MTGLSALPRVVRLFVLAASLPIVLLLSGCGDSYPTDLTYPLRSDLLVDAQKLPDKQPFYAEPPGRLDEHIAQISQLGGKTLNPKDLDPAMRSQLAKALETSFGTPAKPLVKTEDEDGTAAVGELHLGEDVLTRGSALYRRHCLHCHGLTGDGRGPTGPWVNPHPRDYRLGMFKFISSEGNVSRKPRRQDLLRTLEVGIDGTSMPSFALLEPQEREELVSYVIHLSLRGQVEYQVTRQLLSEGGVQNLDTGDVASEVPEKLKTYLVEQWARSNKRIIQPKSAAAPVNDEDRTKAAFKESVARGYTLFTDTKLAANCIGCHVDFGRQAPFRYDAWGTLVRPANLTAGIFRGGRRPIDLYWRIRGGIGPSQMPAAELTDEQTWDLVNFIQTLPYPAMLPENLRDKIYHTQAEKQVAER